MSFDYFICNKFDKSVKELISIILIMAASNTVTYPGHRVWLENGSSIEIGEGRRWADTQVNTPAADQMRPMCEIELAWKRVAELEAQLANALEQISEQNSTIEELYNESEKHRDSAKLLSKWVKKRMKKYGCVRPHSEVVSLQLTKSELVSMVSEAVSESVSALTNGSIVRNRDVIDLTNEE